MKEEGLKVFWSPYKPCRPPICPSMLGTKDAVKKDGTGMNAVSAQFGVPPSILGDQLSGRVVHGTHPGLAPYLKKDKETQLIDDLTSTSSVVHVLPHMKMM